jgi:enamine deaminase RidA (YjgF/YER057c/UK114 family)
VSQPQGVLITAAVSGTERGGKSNLTAAPRLGQPPREYQWFGGIGYARCNEGCATQLVKVMNEPEFFVPPGAGESLLQQFHFSQAVKIGNRVEISGQGNWNDDWEFPESITDEIAQAFRYSIHP